MSNFKDNQINDFNDDSKPLNLIDSECINSIQSDSCSLLSIYNLLDKIRAIAELLERDNSSLRMELAKNVRTISELNEINSYLGKQKDDRDSIKIERALTLSIDYISLLYNEVLNNCEPGHVLRDNIEVMIEDYGKDLEKTGIKLDYYKRGLELEKTSNLSDRPIHTVVKKTGNKLDDNKIVSSTLGYHSMVYIEGFSKPAELVVYSYDKAKDPDFHTVKVKIHNIDSVEEQLLYSGDIFTLPKQLSCSTGLVFRGWSTVQDGSLIDSDCIMIQEDTDIYPVFESKTYEMHIHFQSSIASSVPDDRIYNLKDGEYYHIEFDSYDGCDPNPKYIEGHMDSKSCYVEITYDPGLNQLNFDDHFIIKNGEDIIHSGQPFDYDNVDLMIKTSSMFNYSHIAKFRNLRGSIHTITLNELEKSQNDSDSFIINISYDGNSIKSCNKNNISYKIGSSVVEPVVCMGLGNSSLKLIDHNDSDGMLRLNYSIDINKYTITWTAAYKGINDVTQIVNHGETPKPPDFKPLINYKEDTITIFDGWDKDITAALANRIYTAKHVGPTSLYEFIKNRCKVRGYITLKELENLFGTKSKKINNIINNMVSDGLIKFDDDRYYLENCKD